VKTIGGNDKVVNCHQKYHSEMCFKTTGSGTESAVDYELTIEWKFCQLSYCLYLMGIIGYLLYYFS
jgi:hypothetical protein